MPVKIATTSALCEGVKFEDFEHSMMEASDSRENGKEEVRIFFHRTQ